MKNKFAQLRLCLEPRLPLLVRELLLGPGVGVLERERLGVRDLDLDARLGLAWWDFPVALAFPEERLPVFGIEK